MIISGTDAESVLCFGGCVLHGLFVGSVEPPAKEDERPTLKRRPDQLR
jgi:hypothetical protein